MYSVFTIDIVAYAYTHCFKITQNVEFEFWHFPPIFVLLKLTCLVTLIDRKLQVFKNSPKWNIFGIFNQLLATQNVNVARFARNIECDFLGRFFSDTLMSLNLISQMSLFMTCENCFLCITIAQNF